MHNVTVVVSGTAGAEVLVRLPSGLAQFPSQEEEATTEEPEEGPSPIAPEPKELLWGFGAFIVFLAAMRLYLVPKVKAGMTRRYGSIRANHETADAMREAARGEVAEYEAQLAAVKAEAAARIDAARHQLDGERADRLSEANAAIGERRSAAATEAEAQRAAARGTIEEAAVGVAARIVELSVGRRPADDDVRRAVSDAMSAGARS
jgi:F-type H+-transporting ATPase subunit b